MSTPFLNSVPDFSAWDEAARWVAATIEEAKTVDVSTYASLEWQDIQEAPSSPFGLTQSKKWRKFVLAVFAADLLSYPKPEDQVSFSRLQFVMDAFPQGFRLWWAKSSNDRWLPVGYSGWYPMLETTFELFATSPDKLKSRMVVPQEGSPFLYLFNFSVAEHAKKTLLSKELMQRLAGDIASQNAKGLACITVSSDGVKAATRFGMRLAGHFQNEGVYLLAS